MNDGRVHSLRRREEMPLARSISFVACLLLLMTLSTVAYCSTFNELTIESPGLSCEAPKVVLQSGNVGTSTIYMNGTSAKSTLVAHSPAPLYYPTYANVMDGIYKGGMVTNWWNPDWKYRKSINVTENDIASRTNSTVDVYVTFPDGHAHNSSIRIVRYNGSWNEVPSQVWNISQSGGYINSATISFIVDSIPKNGSVQYYCYYTDSDRGNTDYQPISTTDSPSFLGITDWISIDDKLKFYIRKTIGGVTKGHSVSGQSWSYYDENANPTAVDHQRDFGDMAPAYDQPSQWGTGFTTTPITPKPIRLSIEQTKGNKKATIIYYKGQTYYKVILQNDIDWSNSVWAIQGVFEVGSGASLSTWGTNNVYGRVAGDNSTIIFIVEGNPSWTGVFDNTNWLDNPGFLPSPITDHNKTIYIIYGGPNLSQAQAQARIDLIENPLSSSVGPETTASLISVDSDYYIAANGSPIPGYGFRKQITIENNAAETLEKGYTICVNLDTSSLVSEGKMLASGDDLRLYYWNGGWMQLDREVINMNTSSTQVWFKTQANISVSGSDANYYVYYGNPSAGSPPANKSNVYVFWDDFESGDLNKWSIQSGTWTAATDQRVSGVYSLKTTTGSNAWIKPSISISEKDVLIESYWRSTSSGLDFAQALRVQPGTSKNWFETNVEGSSGWDIAKMVNDAWSEIIINGGSYSANTWYKVTFIVIGETQGKVLVDDIQVTPASGWANIGTDFTTPGTIALRAWSVGTGAWVDDVKVRKYVDPEPSISVGNEEPTGNRITAEFTFTNVTQSIPKRLSLTVVSHFNVTDVNVTIQVWNYSSSSYPTGGEAYTQYFPNGQNITRKLTISTPQFFISGGNAKIRISGNSSIIPFEHSINQIRLAFMYENSYVGSPWWDINYSFRRQITIENYASTTLESGYTVCTTFDSTDLISQGRMLANGDDLRITYWNGSSIVELDREVRNINTSSTEVYFKTQSDIPPASMNDDYYMYHGYPDAINPPSNKSNVYVFYDDFSTDTLSSYQIGRWLSLHGISGYANPTYDGTNKRVNFDTGDNIVTGFRHSITGTNLYAEMRVRWEASYPSDTTIGIGMRWTATNSYYVGHVAHAYYTSPAIALNSRTNYIAIPPSNTYFPKDGTWHKLAFAVWGNNLKLWLDDTTYLSTTDSTITGYGEVVFEVAQIKGSLDDFLVRRYVEPEPSASLGQEEIITYDYVLGIVNQVTSDWKVNLRVYNSLNVGRISSANISFDDGTTSDQIIINGGVVTQSEGTLYDLMGSTTIYISINNLQATTSDTSRLYVYLKIQVPNTSTYNLFVITFEIT